METDPMIDHLFQKTPLVIKSAKTIPKIYIVDITIIFPEFSIWQALIKKIMAKYPITP